MTIMERMPEDRAAAIADEHFRNVEAGKAIRNLKKRQVSKVSFDDGIYIVKTYRKHWYHALWGQPFDSSSLERLSGLTPPCLCDFTRCGWQVTIYDYAGDMDFYKLAKVASLPDNYNELYAEAGRTLAKIHARNLYHADTKTPNFIVNSRIDGLPLVLVIDCDRVVSYKELPFGKRAFNIAQFMACVNIKNDVVRKAYPGVIRSFLKGYSDFLAMQDDDAKKLAEEAVRIAISNPKIERYLPVEELKELLGHVI